MHFRGEIYSLELNDKKPEEPCIYYISYFLVSFHSITTYFVSMVPDMSPTTQIVSQFARSCPVLVGNMDQYKVNPNTSRLMLPLVKVSYVCPVI